MTSAQQRWKLSTIVLRHAALAVAFVAALLGMAAPAAATDYVVVDRNTGLAISGFDPVAYFTEGAPTLGRGAYELTLAGVVWRFSNEGNRAAFAAHPEVYMPRFGGYDPIAAARGVGVAGNPHYWVISGDRLYLFYSQVSQATFTAHAVDAITTADRKWPEVQLTLSP